MKKNIKIISVDFQKDFTSKSGYAYKKRQSVDFVKKILIPFLKENELKISEIISDYRYVGLSNRGDFCNPKEEGFSSDIPEDVKNENIWLKCRHSPIWVRKNIGRGDKEPGKPYQDGKRFGKWLNKEIGKPEEVDMVVLIGLTVNCCILSLAQELYWRGYRVGILEEATDDFTGAKKAKKESLNLIVGNKWAELVRWKELKNKFI